MSQPTINEFMQELPCVSNSVLLNKSKDDWSKELETLSIKELVTLEDTLRAVMLEVVNNKIDYSERIYKKVTSYLEEAREFRKYLLNWEKEFCDDGTLKSDNPVQTSR